MRILPAVGGWEDDLVFRQNFISKKHVEDNGGVVIGVAEPLIEKEFISATQQVCRYDRNVFGESGFSVAMWIKGDYSTGTNTLLDTSPAGSRTFISIEGTGIIYLKINNSASVNMGAYAAWSGFYDVNEWNSLVITGLDSSNTLVSYVNGNQITSTAATAWTAGVVTSLFIGNTNTLSQSTIKRMREVKIWKRVLTLEEIQQLTVS